jgi:hypothetical protein
LGVDLGDAFEELGGEITLKLDFFGHGDLVERFAHVPGRAELLENFKSTGPNGQLEPEMEPLGIVDCDNQAFFEIGIGDALGVKDLVQLRVKVSLLRGAGRDLDLRQGVAEFTLQGAVVDRNGLGVLGKDKAGAVALGLNKMEVSLQGRGEIGSALVVCASQTTSTVSATTYLLGEKREKETRRGRPIVWFVFGFDLKGKGKRKRGKRVNL